MKIIYVNDVGKTVTIQCRKIEPATLSNNKLIIDEDEVIDMRNVIKITD